MLKEGAVAAIAAASLAAAGRPADQALARRIVLQAADLPGATAAAQSPGLSPCAVAGGNPTGTADGRILFFGRSEIVSAARIYARTADARLAATRMVKRLASPCLERALADAYRQRGATFAPGTTSVARVGRHATRVRLRFVLRDRHKHTGEGVYDVVLLQRGRSVAGIAVVNPIDDTWERDLVAKVAARLV
jgi:hypothetical protein